MQGYRESVNPITNIICLQRSQISIKDGTTGHDTTTSYDNDSTSLQLPMTRLPNTCENALQDCIRERIWKNRRKKERSGIEIHDGYQRDV